LVQEAAKELISENRKLRKVHNDVTQEVNQLMNINLLKQKQAWNAKAKDIKLMVE
jgi:dynein heavy chain 2